MHRFRISTIKPPTNKSERNFYYSVEFHKDFQKVELIKNGMQWSEIDEVISHHDIEFICLSQKKSRGRHKYLVKIPTAGRSLPCIDYWKLTHFDRILVIDTNTQICGDSLQSATGFVELTKDGDEFKVTHPRTIKFDPLSKIRLNYPTPKVDKSFLSKIAPLAEKVAIIDLYSQIKNNLDEFLLIVTDCNLGDLASWNERSKEIMTSAPALPSKAYLGYASADRRNAHVLCTIMHQVNAAANLSLK